MTTETRELVERLTVCAKAMREQNPGRGGFQLVTPHAHWLDEAAATITRLTEEVEGLRDGLQSIQYEAEREKGGWVHLKRAIAHAARATLARSGSHG